MKVVVIGGGNGSMAVLMGLKRYVKDITAITSCFDSGGSTGRIRKQFGGIALGDLRRSLIALSDNNLLSKLFEYRFEKGDFEGHAFGNIMLLALRNIYGNDISALEKASELLQIHGKVMPPSLDDCHVCAELEDGEILFGETKIDLLKRKKKIKKIWLEPKANAYPKAIKEIKSADIIIIAPGDVYSSIIPIFLVRGIPEAMNASKAKKVYICNLLTKQSETSGFKASDHLRLIENYCKCKMDAIICNTRRFKNYEAVEIDEENLKGLKVIKADVALEPRRHDSNKLAEVIKREFIK